MKLTYNRIDCGLGEGKKIKLLHTSDSHISHADSRDNERKNALAIRRFGEFGGNRNNYENELKISVDYSKDNCDLLVHTGDAIDFVSYENLDIVKNELGRCPHFFAVGNHEFSQYVGEAWEDDEYRAVSYDLVQSAYKDKLNCDSTVIGGVKLISLDNGYYYFRPEQYDFLRKELNCSLPCILMMHTPLHTRSFYDYLMADGKRECAYLCGTPSELTACYSDHRRRQQTTNELTTEVIEYIASNCGGDKPVRAILAGHLHFDHEDRFAGITQLVTGGGCAFTAREIELA